MHRPLLGFAAAVLLSLSEATAMAASSCPLGFAAPVAYDRGSGLRTFVVAGDLNGDGRPDLFVLHLYDADGQVGSALINRGRGVFEPFPLLVPGLSFSTALIADVNGDGRNDLVLAGGPALTVLPGHGDGTFGKPITSDVRNVNTVVAGHFHGNATVDLAVTQSTPSEMAILSGDGKGNFTVGATYALTGGAQAVTTNDFNGDGFADLVVSDTEAVKPYFGKGDGTFTKGANVDWSLVPAQALGSADLNGDGVAELLIGSQPFIDEFRLTPAGVFQLVSLNTVAQPVSVLTVADMDGDGRSDIVAIGGGEIGVLRGTAPNTFAAVAAYGAGGAANSGAVVDLDGNGFPEVVTADGRSTQIYVVRNTGGALDSTRMLDHAGPVPSGIIGSPSAPVSGFALTTADLDRDGRADLISGDRTTGDITVFLLGPQGRWTEPFNIATLPPPPTNPKSPRIMAIESGDLDGDKNNDIVVLSGDGSTLTFLYVGTNAHVTKTTSMTLTKPICCIDITDFNSDGKADLIYANTQGTVSVLLSNGSSFQPAANYSTRNGLTAMAAGDLNGDKQPDVVVAANGGKTIDTFKGAGTTLTFAAEATVNDTTAVAIAPMTSSIFKAVVTVGRDAEFWPLDAALKPPSRTIYQLPTAGNGVLVFDANADGAADLVISGADRIYGEPYITELLNDGKDSFRANVSIGTGKPVQSMVTADVEGNGSTDLIFSTADQVVFAPSRCAPPRVALAMLPQGAGGPPTLLVESLSEFDRVTSYAITEGATMLATVPADPKAVGVGRLSVSLSPGNHVLTAVATLADGSTISSDSLTVSVPMGRRRAAGR